MKYFFALILLLPLFTMAQTTSENNYVKATWISGNSVNQTISITNKQSCDVPIQVKQGTYDTTYTISPSSTLIATFNRPFAAGVSINVKAQQVCSNNGSAGTINIYGSLYALPIKFNSVTTKLLPNNVVEVTFDVAEVSGVNKVNIQLSSDGFNFVTRTIVFPENTQANHIYKVQFKL